MTRIVPHPEEALQVTDVHEIAKYPCTAHFPGYYPDLTCAQCKNYIACNDKRKGRCLEHFAFRGMAYRFDLKDKDEDWWRGLPTIRGETLACKYFTKADPP